MSVFKIDIDAHGVGLAMLTGLHGMLDHDIGMDDFEDVLEFFVGPENGIDPTHWVRDVISYHSTKAEFLLRVLAYLVPHVKDVDSTANVIWGMWMKRRVELCEDHDIFDKLLFDVTTFVKRKDTETDLVVEFTPAQGPFAFQPRGVDRRFRNYWS